MSYDLLILLLNMVLAKKLHAKSWSLIFVLFLSNKTKFKILCTWKYCANPRILTNISGYIRYGLQMTQTTYFQKKCATVLENIKSLNELLGAGIIHYYSHWQPSGRIRSSTLFDAFSLRNMLTGFYCQTALNQTWFIVLILNRIHQIRHHDRLSFSWLLVAPSWRIVCGAVSFHQFV